MCAFLHGAIRRPAVDLARGPDAAGKVVALKVIERSSRARGPRARFLPTGSSSTSHFLIRF
jgi:hypothetical protein